MKMNKSLRTILISVLAAAIIALTAAYAAINSVGKAFAARYVELTGNTVFYTSIRGAEITESAVEKIPGDDNDHRYTLFTIEGDEKVDYRQNIAYAWKYSVKDEDGKSTGEVVDGYFNMEFSFASTYFKQFILEFQSQQHIATEEHITKNYLIFETKEGGSKEDDEISLKVTQSLEEKDGAIEGEQIYSRVFAAKQHIKIEFVDMEEASGEYGLIINGDLTELLTLKNMYKPYSTYVSSGDNAVTPMVFSATFGEDSVGVAEFVLYDMNGQSFEMTEQSGTYKVEDTASPVLCFDTTPSYLRYGETISLQYKAIDVLVSSPRANAYYYILTGEQYKNENGKFDYDKTDYSVNASDGEDDDEDAWEDPFIQVSSTSNIRLMKDEKTFIPSKYVDGGVYGLVKIYYEISDSSGSTAITDQVSVDWYISNKDALVDIYGEDLKNEPDKHSYFLKLMDDKEGATYAQPSDLGYGTVGETDPVLDNYKARIKEIEAAYQQQIDDAIAAVKDKDGEVVGKLFAGSDQRFYLPEITYKFAFDEYFTAKDYKYSIYYRAKSSGNRTGLAFNNLYISLSEADVTYRFTIFVTDVFGSDMRYPTLDGDEIVWKTISPNDVWDEEYSELLPFFEFDVSYREAVGKNPENLSTAYVNTSYGGVSFDIDGVSGTYDTSYKLYLVDREKMNADLGNNFTYNEFKEELTKLFNNEGDYASKNTRKYFATVKAASELIETDANYDEYKAINWNANTVTFTPQSVSDYYVVELTITDKRSQTSTKNYAVVAASVATTALKGESDWLKNNTTSVILLAIAGACLIALIVLLIVKPKDKGDIDAVYERSEKKAKKSKK